uniref:Leucine rich repeat transmembrane neuronal 4 n=2 Tax=Eptatretus burgeri TaxID=7764 RepID=A0A8C4R0E2_EPTBU
MGKCGAGRWTCSMTRWLLLLVLHSAKCACPEECRCEERIVFCESRALREIPLNISAGTHGLSLRYNSLKTVPQGQFAGVQQLTWLYLDHNNIQDVTAGAFQGTRRLKELILSSNKITQLPVGVFHPLVNLRKLDLSYNQLEALAAAQFNGLRKLQALNLRSNQLRTLPVRIFQECRALEVLDLGYNRVRVLARNVFTGLGRLMQLHLEHNHYNKINLAHFPRLSNLRTFYLQWNRITMITMERLSWTWHSLHTLDLSGNELKIIGPLVFESLPNLRNLRLDSNRLSSIPSYVLSAWRNLVSISLPGNPWDCGRNVCALAEWLQEFGGRQDGDLLCGAPEHLQGQSLTEAISSGQGVCLPAAASPSLTSLPPLFGGFSTFQSETNNDTIYFGEESLSTSFTSPEELVTSTAGWDINAEDGNEQASLYKILAGSVALVLSVLIILLVVYVTWKRYPASLGEQLHPGGVQEPSRRPQHHRRHSPQPKEKTAVGALGRRNRKAESKGSHQTDGLVIAQEYYVDYKSSEPETGELLGNGSAYMLQSGGTRDCPVFHSKGNSYCFEKLYVIRNHNIISIFHPE